MEYIVTDIQRFCMHDGFGIRTTVFLKGCPLKCFWCHNPETSSVKPELYFYSAKCINCGGCEVCENNAHLFNGKHTLNRQNCKSCGKCADICPTGALSMVGKVMTGEEIINTALRDSAFYKSSGGITLSGGEPMLYPEKCIELLKLAKQNNLNTAVETSGYFDEKYVEPLCLNADCLLWDIKDTDNLRHIKNTGVSIEKILNNLYLADKFNVPIILRCVLLKGVNLNPEHLSEVKRIYKSLKNAVRVDFLPCHSLGNSKAQALGQNFLSLKEFEPKKEDIIYAENFIKNNNYRWEEL